MLNIEKVKSMTKAAAYESGPEKKNLEIDSFYRGDFLGLHMIKSGIAYTLSFVVLFAVWCMSVMEELMLMITRAGYLESLVRTILILYVSGLAVYEILIYAYHSLKYEQARKSVKSFYMQLRNIDKFYEKEESAIEEITEIHLTDEEIEES